MNFYSAFSRNYDQIFPLKEKKLNLLAATFADLQEKQTVKMDEKDMRNEKSTVNEKDEKIKETQVQLLDVGCGTGSYALALAERGYQVTGIDLDPEMIGMARDKLNNINEERNKKLPVKFQEIGMLDIKRNFSPGSFDGIYIIGNVLVHLDNSKQIADFLKGAAELLRPQGRLFIQIVNYERILSKGLKGLPTIYSSDGNLRFERDYEYREEKEVIYFKTALIAEENRSKGEHQREKVKEKVLHKNNIPLYPLTRDELLPMLEEVGFRMLNLYGKPNGEKYQPLESVPLIVSGKLE